MNYLLPFPKTVLSTTFSTTHSSYLSRAASLPQDLLMASHPQNYHLRTTYDLELIVMHYCLFILSMQVTINFQKERCPMAAISRTLNGLVSTSFKCLQGEPSPFPDRDNHISLLQTQNKDQKVPAGISKFLCSGTESGTCGQQQKQRKLTKGESSFQTRSEPDLERSQRLNKTMLGILEHCFSLS